MASFNHLPLVFGNEVTCPHCHITSEPPILGAVVIGPSHSSDMARTALYYSIGMYGVARPGDAAYAKSLHNGSHPL